MGTPQNECFEGAEEQSCVQRMYEVYEYEQDKQEL